MRRFLRKLGWARPLPFRRFECAPGVEAQVDFGTGAPVVGAAGKRRRTHVFRNVLSHSRKAYSEVTYRQTTEDFRSALENAFRHFGGVPQTVVIENLKAAVKHPDWFDPELVPKLAAFAAHYGTVVLPTRPYTPRHKGKVERGIDYVQENALKSRTFASLEEQNRHLEHWEAGVADTRIHGTTPKCSRSPARATGYAIRPPPPPPRRLRPLSQLHRPPAPTAIRQNQPMRRFHVPGHASENQPPKPQPPSKTVANRPNLKDRLFRQFSGC